LLLARGGNLEVTAQMKAHIDKWGRARYGQKIWPQKVRDELPALVLGITGIDEEFRDREEYADPMLYNTRFAQLADALGDVMGDFGGKDRAFTNCYPIRYPGTWDANQKQRDKSGPDKWEHAGKAFLKAKMVQTYVADAEDKWAAAMRDGDGGLSVISAGWRAVTTAEKKQDQLEKQVEEIHSRLLQLARGWVIDPDANVDREKRIRVAKKVLDWLTSDRQLIYERVQAMKQSLCLDDGDQWAVSDFADMPTPSGAGRPDSMERRFPRQLQNYLQEWATNTAPKHWEQYVAEHADAGPWLSNEDMFAFVRYLKDYLLSDAVFDDLKGQLLRIVGLKLRDESAKRRARRKYVRVMMNDFFINPGPTGESIVSGAGGRPEGDEGDNGDDREIEGGMEENVYTGQVDGVRDRHDSDEEDDFGLMYSFVERWRGRLPQALALGAGTEVRIPPGNPELIEMLEPYGGVS
jgi:hypothetical protein